MHREAKEGPTQASPAVKLLAAELDSQGALLSQKRGRDDADEPQPPKSAAETHTANGASTPSLSTLTCSWGRRLTSTRTGFLPGEASCSLLGEPLNPCLLAAHEERLASEAISDDIGLQLMTFKRAARLLGKFDLSEIDTAIVALTPLVTERK